MNEPTPQDKQQEIRFNPGVWNFMEGTRAAFYSTGTLTDGSFTAAAYVAGSTTSYFDPVTVNWATDKWVFDGGKKYYWPAEGTLDFFAYMPATAPTYITSGPTYTTARNPQFTCGSLPMTYNSASPTEGQGSGLQEFVYALVTGQNKAEQGASGVALNFLHPFARINLQLSASHLDITINKITFKSIKNNGAYTHNGSPKWAATGDATNLVLTFEGDDAIFNNNLASPLTQIGPSFIMIPQNWAGAIEVEATWTDWGEQLKHYVTASVPTDWEPGKSYTYTFTITETDLIVNTTDKYTEQW